MLQFVPPDVFQSSSCVLPDPQGIDAVHAYVRGTFDLKGRLLPWEEQTPISEGDIFYGEPETTEIKTPSDLTLGKPGTDVLLNAIALPQLKGSGGNKGEVSLRVGCIDKTLSIFGDRKWETTFWRTRISEPKPFESMPLRWCHAYGGADVQNRNFFEARNPLGCGFVGKNERPEDGRPLPNIESPEASIRSWKDRPSPAGFGPIAAHWQPRLGYAGTYDDAWQKSRAPVLPADFDLRHFCTAPADQIVAGHLVGGEQVEITGVHKDGPVHLALPKWEHVMDCRFEKHTESAKGKLETVFIDLVANQLVLVWASHLSCDRRALQIKEISIRSVAR